MTSTQGNVAKKNEKSLSFVLKLLYLHDLSEKAQADVVLGKQNSGVVAAFKI